MDELSQMGKSVKPSVDVCEACSRRNNMSDKSKTIRGMTTPTRAWTLFLISGGLLLLCTPGGAQTQDGGGFNINTVIGCFVRDYNLTVWKEGMFRGSYCWDTVTVGACWGRCVSTESGDYKPPYKFSEHPVCTYKRIQTRRVRLTNCHPDHPDPFYEIFDAVECHCSECNSAITSCENLAG